MKRILLAGAAFAALTSASYAADFADPVDVDIWSGFFVGIQGGYSWKDLDVEVTGGGVTGVGGVEADDFVIGAYYGRNWQSDNLVFGLDSSISYIGLDETFVGAPLAATLDIEANFLGLSRLKVGYAFDNVLLFVAGGVALTSIDVETPTDDDDGFGLGWTIGGGVEVKISENWSARVEAAYFSIEDDYSLDVDALTVDLDLDGTIVRGGVAYHF